MQGMVVVLSREPIFICPLCNYAWCRRCKCDWHSFQTCDQHQRDKLSSKHQVCVCASFLCLCVCMRVYASLSVGLPVSLSVRMSVCFASVCLPASTQHGGRPQIALVPPPCPCSKPPSLPSFCFTLRIWIQALTPHLCPAGRTA